MVFGMAFMWYAIDRKHLLKHLRGIDMVLSIVLRMT